MAVAFGRQFSAYVRNALIRVILHKIDCTRPFESKLLWNSLAQSLPTNIKAYGKEKMKVLLYLKKSGIDKSGKAPIMGRITLGRSIAQFSCKLSCNPGLWNPRESRMNGKSREAVEVNGRLEHLLLSIQSAYQSLIDNGSHLMQPM